MLLLGLASGVHCVGMCGGFVGAFSQARVIRIHPGRRPWRELALFNAGRITSYAIAGAAVLALGAYGLAHAEGMAGGVRALLCL